VYAGPGRDHIWVGFPDERTDRIDCGKGIDVVEYSKRRERRDRFIHCEHIRRYRP
jgi:hypothetical protein